MKYGNAGAIAAAVMVATIALGAANVAFASPEGDRSSAVLAARVSLTQAITAAEERAKGRAMNAEMERHKGAYSYEIKVLSENKVIEVQVDPSSGQVTRTEGQGFFERLFDREDEAEFRQVAGTATTLGAAIATAEKEVGGKAIKAATEDEDGKMLIEIKVAKDKALHMVNIDPASGKVVKIHAVKDEDEESD